jgi:hypothetical protein
MIAALIAERRRRLFHDRASVRPLEAFLQTAVDATGDLAPVQGVYGPSALAALSTNSVSTASP